MNDQVRPNSKKGSATQLLILTTDRLPSLNKFIDGLKRLKPGIGVRLATYQELDFNLEGLKNQINLSSDNQDIASFDMVYFKSTKNHLDIAAAIAQYLKKRNVLFVDSTVSDFPSNSKLYQYVILNDNNIEVPRSLLVLPGRLQQSFKLFQETLDLPFILKDVNGSKGQYNYLIASEQDFNLALNKARENNIFLIGQVFIANDQDYRILVFGQEVGLVISRRRADNSTHLNNLSIGGISKLINKGSLPNEVLKDCLKAARLLGREVAGVDMVQDIVSHKWYCLEVNDGPQIATGSFRDEKLKAFSSYLTRSV